jgi:uncharacterized FlaG/YvyC family protein
MDDRMRRKIYLVLTLIWIIALILSLPQFLFSKVSSTKIASDRDYINYNNKELKSRVEKDLKDLVALLNRIIKPTKTRGKFTLSGAYGGWQLQRYIKRNGKETTAIEAITSGYIPKKELYYFMKGMSQ